MTTRIAAVAAVAGVLAACGPALTPASSPTMGAAPTPIVTPRATLRTALPSRLAPTTWRVGTTARVSASGPGLTTAEQRVETRALVSWTLQRSRAGGLRGTGQIDSFTVRTSLDTSRTPSAPALLLVEAATDSLVSRVITRPPLPNECDRPEASAAALAREPLVRIPDGAAIGDRWRDSTVTLVCRSGVPLTVYTTTWSTLEALNTERLVVTRTITTRLEGKGGSPFRSLAVTGLGTGTQRVDLRASDGTLSTLEGTSTLTLQVKETTPPAPPRTSQVVQRVELRVERVSPR